MEEPAPAESSSPDRPSPSSLGGRESAVIVVLLLLAFFWTAIGFNLGAIIVDEGLTVYPATRILKGDVIYRDFFTNYGPANFYAIAAVFKAFGVSLLAHRLYMVILSFLLGVLVFLFACEMAGPGEAALAAFVVLTWPLDNYIYGCPTLGALLGAVGAGLAIHRRGWSGDVRAWVLAGALAGVCALFRHDFGLSTLLAELLTLAALAMVSRKQESALQSVRFAAWSLLGFIAAVGVPTLLLLATVPLGDLYDDLVRFPATQYLPMYHMPYPLPFEPLATLEDKSLGLLDYALLSSQRLQFYFPFLVMGLAGWLAAGNAIRSGRPGVKESTVVMLILLEAAFIVYLAGIPNKGHSLPAITVGAVLFAYAARELRRTGRRALLAFLVLFVVAMSFCKTYQKLDLAASAFRPGAWAPLTVPRGAGIQVSHEVPPQCYFALSLVAPVEAKEGVHDCWVEYEQCIQYIQKTVPPDEPIFVANATRLPGPVVSDTLFYVLSERDSASRFYNLVPMSVDPAGVGGEIIRSMESKGVKRVVMVQLVGGEKITSPTPLDNYIRTHFRLERGFGPYAVYKRIDGVSEKQKPK